MHPRRISAGVSERPGIYPAGRADAHADGRKALPAAEGGSFSQSISNCMKNVRRLRVVCQDSRTDHSEHAQAVIRQEAW